MLAIVLTILFNAGLFLSFKSYKAWRINTFQAVVTNYWVCTVLGLFVVGGMGPVREVVVTVDWVWYPLSVGLLFISVFYLMGVTSRESGVAVATVANKMSMAIPMLLSATVLAIPAGPLTWVNGLGMLLALPAILLTAVKRQGLDGNATGARALVFPLIVFIGGGLVDTALNYANHFYLTDSTRPVFILICFFSAAFLGLVVLVEQTFSKKVKLSPKSIGGGIYLGLINYYSLHYLLAALTEFGSDALYVFPVVNLGTIVVATSLSVLLFGERLSKANGLGILLALTGIVLLSVSCTDQ